MITVQVKTPKEKQAVEIEDNAQVRKVCQDNFFSVISVAIPIVSV